MAGEIRGGLQVVFDGGIEKIDYQYGSNTGVITASGNGVHTLSIEPGNDLILTATLKSGYTLASTTIGTIDENVVTIAESDLQFAGEYIEMAITLTSKPIRGAI